MTGTSYLTIRGVRIAYSDAGTGPVVLNAHGLTGSRASSRQAGGSDYAELVENGYRVISYDARGHGESEGTEGPEDYGWGAFRWSSWASSGISCG
jgi:3-oxoadipate enol-lactonase